MNLNLEIDNRTLHLVGGVMGLLVLASAIGFGLSRTVKAEKARATVANMNARIRAWWVMVFIFVVAILSGRLVTVILFGFTSFMALREFITLTPTRPGDHRTLFWAFFLVTPLQYYLVAIEWYGLFSILIPVYAFLLLPVRSAAAGDCTNFLARTSEIQWGLMICVYCVSHAPALLILEIEGYENAGPLLLFFLVLVVQLSDVLQYVFGKLLGRRPVAPTVSPNKTVEGFLGGVLTASLIGGCLAWATPFNFWQACAMSLLITMAGFFGGLVMSAIKRDRGVKDYGQMIEGHGGVLDRIDSICFAAPFFFHVTRYFFA
ncbi:MAG TPA: phosphatidate cytidylyltransferase [Verrucomicrobiales bacterium]|nr:phosphatidate cytidylyltransferase [Verrucomicrobiales bacterium]